MCKTFALLSFGIAFLFLACENGEPEPASPTITLSQEIIDAVEQFVGATGLDGDTFSLTDPLECDSIAALVDAAGEEEAGEIIQGTVGKLCLGPADVGETTTTVSVGIYATEASWELTLARQDDRWQVSDVQFTGQ